MPTHNALLQVDADALSKMEVIQAMIIVDQICMPLCRLKVSGLSSEQLL
jgi:hypothetical protein